MAMPVSGGARAGLSTRRIAQENMSSLQTLLHCLLISGGKYTTINHPHQSSTVLSTINNNNVIAGAYTDSANVEHGFTLQNGKVTTIDYPGAANTVVGQVNDNGAIAGTYYDSSYSTWEGFVLRNGTFTKISDPAASTQLW